MKMEELTYILTEMQSLDGISSPLRSTNRIKFSCFTASSNFLAFGATSGGIYVFKRDTCMFMYILPNKEGALTQILVSSDEKWFGFATVKGLSCILEHSIGSIRRRIVSTEHEGVNVTALQWNPMSSQLFVGDELGRISVISTSSFLAPTIVLMQLDSKIVQLDCHSHLLLASTITRCYLCDTFREQYRQIGSRPRDGSFGGCFFSGASIEALSNLRIENEMQNENVYRPYKSFFDGELLLADENLKNVKIFCTRPGLRLWEVHIDGTVISTHQFKRLLDTPPTGVIRPPPSEIPLLPHTHGHYSSEAFNFSTLHHLASKFLFTFHSDGIYVLDPISGDVVLWTDAFMGIKDVSAVGHTLFVWMGGFQLHSVNLLTLDKFLIQLYLQKQYNFCASICASYVDVLSRQVSSSSFKLQVLNDLLDKLKENNVLVDDTVNSKVSHLLSEISKNAHGQHYAQILNSGIFVVGNAHLLSQREEVRPLDHIRLSNLSIQESDALQENKSNKNDSINAIINPDLSRNNLFVDPNNFLEESEIDDYDPFADLPLSALTSPETVAALKHISSTMTETFSSGTKSLREKWNRFEGKIRASEPHQPSFSVRSMNESNELHTELTPSEETRDAIPSPLLENTKDKSFKMFVVDTVIFKNLCNNISLCVSEGQESENLYAEFLETLSVLFETFRKFIHNPLIEIKFDHNLMVGKENMGEIMNNLFSTSWNFSFPFKEYFSHDLILEMERHFHSCLSTGTLAAWLKKFLSSYAFESFCHPMFYKSMFTEKDLILDQILGKFLQISFSLLNPFIVLKCLDDSQAPCQYWSWNVVVNCFSRVSSFGTFNRDSGNWPLPCLLNAMLVVLQRGQTESCRNLGSHVPVKYVLRLMLKLDEDVTKLFTMFLNYLDKLPIQRLQMELEDVEVQNFTKLAFQELKKEDCGSQCQCGFPLQITKLSVTFNRICFAFLRHLWEVDDKPAVFNLCHYYGLWSQLLSLRRGEDLVTVLPLLLHAGCIGELRTRCKEMTAFLWQQTFQLQEKLQAGICLGCSHTFETNEILPSSNWSALASFLIQQTDPKFAMHLINKFLHGIPPGSIDLKFYQSCLLATLSEQHRKGSSKALLDLVMYSAELPCLSVELAEKIDSTVKIETSPWERHHWGLHLKLGETNCVCCLLPLNCPSVLQGWGVTGFKCGHVFHRICLVQSHIIRCPVCFT